MGGRFLVRDERLRNDSQLCDELLIPLHPPTLVSTPPPPPPLPAPLSHTAATFTVSAASRQSHSQATFSEVVACCTHSGFVCDQAKLIYPRNGWSVFASTLLAPLQYSAHSLVRRPHTSSASTITCFKLYSSCFVFFDYEMVQVHWHQCGVRVSRYFCSLNVTIAAFLSAK